MEIVLKGESITKGNLTSEAIRYYRIKKRESIAEFYKKSNINLIDEEEEVNLYTKKNKKKEPKKSTVQETCCCLLFCPGGG